MRSNPAIFRRVALERLSSPDQLDYLMQVTRPHGWLALIAAGVPILAAFFWGVFGSIPLEVSAHGALLRSDGTGSRAGQLTGRLYLPIDSGQRIRQGMAVRLTTRVLAGAEQGDLQGEVTRVSEVTSIPSGIAPLIRNDRLSAELILQGRLIQVDVAVQAKDPQAPAGLERAVVATSPARRMAVDGSVTVQKIRPIQLVLGGWN